MLYNFLLFLYFFVSVPKILYDTIFLKKKKTDLLKRFGFKKYRFAPKDKSPIIWIHAVSMGETKAAKALLERLKLKHPNSYIIISSVTITGHNEAKKSLNLADKFIFFPFDFSYSVKKVFDELRPDIIIFMETDLWLNFTSEAKKQNIRIFLVSAKISEKSMFRFCKFKRFSKKLFSNFDLILSQNELYKSRFCKINPSQNIFVTGNLKLVNTMKQYPKEFLSNWKEKLNIQNEDVITIASTHSPEEENLIKELKDIDNIKILLAPRHPERFMTVYKQVQKLTSCALLSQIENKKIDTKVIVIDKMGILNALFQISTLAIVGGSFINTVGGHNILEPVFANIPVFFGPFMFSQLELRKIILEANSGKETNFQNIHENVLNFLRNPNLQNQMFDNCKIISNKYQNILDITFEKIQSYI